MGIIEIEPIKITFFQKFLKAIGKAVNADVIDRLAFLEREMCAIKYNAAENSAKQARIRILRFGDEIYNGIRHTKEHFDQILLDITEYERYCDEHKEFENNMTVATTRRIKEVYHECLKYHKFTAMDVHELEMPKQHNNPS